MSASGLWRNQLSSSTLYVGVKSQSVCKIDPGHALLQHPLVHFAGYQAGHFHVAAGGELYI